MAKQNQPPEVIYPDGPVAVLKLETPIPKTDPPVVELKFWRRLTVADLVAMQDKGLVGYRKTVDMLRRVTLVSSSDIMRMDAYDFDQADDVLASFLLRGPNSKSESSGSPSSEESSD